MSTRSRKKKCRRLRRRIRDLDDAIAKLFKVRNRRANVDDDEGAERVMRRIRIREHRCADLMSKHSDLRSCFDLLEAAMWDAMVLIAEHKQDEA